MAARTMSLGTHDIDFLKDTLSAQQELLQRLYNELDVERESSSTAADETLSMILRLQGEKAAMEMEASQYKRIAEEKMCHAQETLEIFQELIYQKEMQIASLEFQVQAYKFKLASMGCEDLATCDMQYPDNMLLRKNGTVGETSAQNTFRRGNSLPPPVNFVMSRRSSTDGSRTATSSPKTLQEGRSDPPLKRETTQGDYNSYWQEIKKLDERVKGLTSLNSLNSIPTPEGARDLSDSSLSNPPASSASLHDPSPDNSPARLASQNYSEKVPNDQTCEESPCSISVQDIFEVPQCTENNQGDTSHKKENPELSLVKEIRNLKLDSAWHELWKSDPKESIDWEKQPLLSPEIDRHSLKPKDVEEKTDWEKKPLLPPTPKDGRTEKPKLLKHPTYGVADFELQQFNRRLKQLEDERFLTRAREINFEAGDEGLKLLREIMEKVDSVQAEVTSWRTKMPPQPEDRSFGCFKEVMFCFLPKP